MDRGGGREKVINPNLRSFCLFTCQDNKISCEDFTDV